MQKLQSPHILKTLITIFIDVHFVNPVIMILNVGYPSHVVHVIKLLRPSALHYTATYYLSLAILPIRQPG